MSGSIFKLFVCLAILLNTAPAEAETVSAEADKELQAGHFEAACKLYRLALTTHRSDVTILINASKAYEGAGDLDEAIHRAREATVFEPNNADAHLALGHCLDMNRESKAAILQFDTVLDLKKANSATRKAAYGPLLRLLNHEHQLEKLAKTGRRGAHDFPKDADCHFNCGWALSQQTSNDPKELRKTQTEAALEYQKCIELKESRPAVHLDLKTKLGN